MICRLRWHLVTIAPDVEAQLRPAALKGLQICARLTRQLARLPQSPRLRVAKRLLKRIAEIGRAQRELLAELTTLIDAHAPQLLAQPGCGPVTAAIIVGHTAGAQRFPSDGHFARHAGTAPIPASSGNTQRHRLHRGGNRQLNRAIHIIALSRARTDPATRAYLARNTPKAKPSAKRFAASNASSPAASGACSTPPRPQPPRPCRSLAHTRKYRLSLDTGAASAGLIAALPLSLSARPKGKSDRRLRVRACLPRVRGSGCFGWRCSRYRLPRPVFEPFRASCRPG